MNQFRPSGFSYLPPAVKNLLIINGLMYLATGVLGSKFNVDLVSLLGLHYFASNLFEPWQLITHMFMHGSLGHIFSNMFALWMFGTTLENVWGSKRFLIYYFICGLGAAFMQMGVTGYQYHALANEIYSYQSHPGISAFVNLFTQHGNLLSPAQSRDLAVFYKSWAQHPADASLIESSKQYSVYFLSAFADVPMIGASGAVFGVLAAFGMLFPNTELYFYFLVPIKAKYFVTFYALFELYAGFSGTQQGVAHFAHVGGALIGALIIIYWRRNRKFFY